MRNKYEVHPLAVGIPRSTEKEYNELYADIRKNGQLVPAMLDRTGTFLLDGQTRQRICNELDLTLRVERTDTLPEVFIWAAQKRRNLTPDQYTILAVEMTRILAEEAEKRSRANLKNQSNEVVKTPPRGKRRKVVAEMAGVSEYVARQGLEVEKNAPHLVEKVKGGEIKLSDAAKEARQTTKGEEPEETFDEDKALDIIGARLTNAIRVYWPPYRDLSPVETRLAQVISNIRELDATEHTSLATMGQTEQPQVYS